MKHVARRNQHWIGRLAAVALLGAASCFAPVHAAEPDLGSLKMLAKDGDSSPIPTGVVLGGVAIGYTPRHQAQSDNLAVVPGAVYFGDKFLYLGDRARYYFHQNDGIGGFVYGRYRLSALDPEDDPALAGMHKREGQFEMGLGMNVVTPYALLTFRAVSDVSGTSKGQEFLVWADFPVIRGRWLFMPGVGAMWRSSKMANYYFGGVGADEVAPGRPAYDTGSTISPMASLVTTYRFNKQWIGTLSLAYEYFDRSIAKSPTINHTGEWTFITGIGYVW